MLDQKKEEFFKRYAFAADGEALELIWKAKQSEATWLSLRNTNILDLSLMKYLESLQELDISDTNVSTSKTLLMRRINRFKTSEERLSIWQRPYHM